MSPEITELLLNISLLEQSIEHWTRLRDGTKAPDEDHYSSSCPLCKEYYIHPQLYCQHCPIYQDTGKRYCALTPWTLVHEHFRDTQTYHPRLCQMEIDYLTALLTSLRTTLSQLEATLPPS